MFQVMRNQTCISSPPLRFPQKLWKIANECQSGALTWSAHGKSILLRYSLFKKEFMHVNSDFFKTDNISSFVRQLNLYGFRKVYHANKQGYKGHPDLHEFSNVHFQRDRPELLESVVRKSAVLKDRNDISFDVSYELDTTERNEAHNCRPIDFPEDNHPDIVKISNISSLIPPLPDHSEIPESLLPPLHIALEPTFSGVDPKLERATDPPVQPPKKKRGRKPGSRTDPSKLKRTPRQKRNNHRKIHQDWMLKLVDYTEEEATPFLRNTSRDVMLSSTLPFQESPEYLELNETFRRLYEPKVRVSYAPLPLPLFARINLRI